MAESEARIGIRPRPSVLQEFSDADVPRSATTGAHAVHAHDGTASRRLHTPRWLVYLSAVAAVAVIVYLVVPDGGSTALLVLFAGLMMLHHLPGLGHHGGRATRPAATGEKSIATDSGDSARGSARDPPCH